jgi:hypothetical protein
VLPETSKMPSRNSSANLRSGTKFGRENWREILLGGIYSWGWKAGKVMVVVGSQLVFPASSKPTPTSRISPTFWYPPSDDSQQDSTQQTLLNLGPENLISALIPLWLCKAEKGDLAVLFLAEAPSDPFLSLSAPLC